MDTSAASSISEVAAQTGFSASALRYYERIGLVEPGRTAAGYRKYDRRSVERLRFIARGKDLGLSLDEIAELLPAWDGADCRDVAGPLAERVAQKAREARSRIAELAALAEGLEVAHRRLAHQPTAGPCGPSCTCSRFSVVDTGRAPVVLGTKPAASAVETEPVACTLSADVVPDRLDDWSQLLAQRSTAPVRRVGDGTGSVTVRFPPDPTLTRTAAGLVAAEQACCTFIAFSLRIDQTGTELTATTALDGLPVIDALFGVPA